jgi:hypothetical protein
LKSKRVRDPAGFASVAKTHYKWGLSREDAWGEWVSTSHESGPGSGPGSPYDDPGQDTPGASWINEEADDASDGIFAQASPTATSSKSWIDEESDAAAEKASPPPAPAPKRTTPAPAPTKRDSGNLKLGAIDDFFQRAKKIKEDPNQPPPKPGPRRT